MSAKERKEILKRCNQKMQLYHFY
ncbi:hypothetical protein [Colwellia sp. E150_009]